MVEPRSRTEPGRADSSPPAAALAEWQGRVRHAEATSLAREGNLALAERKLSGIDQMAQSAACLDLLARIRAQQGRLAEARTLWLAASQLEPDKHSWVELAEKAKSWQTRRLGRDRLPLYAAVPAVVALTVVAWAVLRHSAPDTVITSPRAGMFLESENERTTRQTTSPARAAVAGLIPAPAAPSTAPTPDVSLPGVSVMQDGRAMLVVFDDGLFSSGTRMTPAGRRTLMDLARQLKGKSEGVMITIIGHTDDLGLVAGTRYSDNISLGLARAAAVAEYLRRAADLQANGLLLRSLGPEDSPFPQESAEGRLRNRTAVIRFDPRSATTEAPR